MWFQSLLRKLASATRKDGIRNALALQHRGEVRGDGLTLIDATHQLVIRWRARGIHPWDEDCGRIDADRQFNEQCYADTAAAISRLFDQLPWVDTIRFQVLNDVSDDLLLGGTVTRSASRAETANISARTRLWHMGVKV